MRNGLILGGVAAALSVAALVVAVIALVNSTAGPPADAPLIFSSLKASFKAGPPMADRPGFTVDLVQQALDRYDQEGREATLDYYNSPESIAGEWYVFILDEDDRAIAHRTPSVLGRDLKGDLGVDQTGYRFGEVMLAATEEGRWVDYLFLNPDTGNQEFKHSWVIRHDGLLFGSGWYQVLPTNRDAP